MNPLHCVAILAYGVLALASVAMAADDKPALSGVWVQKGSDLKIEFADKDTVKVSPHGDKAPIVIVCKYTADKDGAVKATVKDFEGKEELKDKIKAQVPVGLEFSFTWKVKDATATLGEVKGKGVEGLKSHLEGDYTKK
jgi:hypothetical protein